MGGIGSCWYYDTSGPNVWLEGPRLKSPRRLATTAVLNGAVYVLGGLTGTDYDHELGGYLDERGVATVERLCLSNNSCSWEMVPSMLLSSGACSSIAIQPLASIFVVGACNEGDEGIAIERFSTHGVERSDIGRGHWDVCGHCLTTRYDALVVAVAVSATN